MKEYRIGRLAGLELTAQSSVVSSSIALWAVLAALAALILKMPAGTAVLMGLAALILHEFSDLVHQLGHAVAARRTGHPMIGVRFWGLLSTSLYPEDEPTLPADVHIRRALGGPIASLILSFFAWGLMVATRADGGPVWWVAVFFLAENAVVFTLQAFIPLGFNDGSTLWYWLRKR
jgi:fatty acid desaturase